jgi:hypothetical protein
VAITVASASFFIGFSSPAEGLGFIANIALMQVSAQRTLNITIDHFVMAVTGRDADARSRIRVTAASLRGQRSTI